MRFPGPFTGDQRFPFNEGQVPRGPIPGDPNLRHQGPRYALYITRYIWSSVLYNTISKITTNKNVFIYVILST